MSSKNIFSLKLDGSDFTVIHDFNTTEGTTPQGSLIQGSDGNLYGMTLLGGVSGKGVVFKINTSGSSYTVLQNFTRTSGGSPYGSLIQDSEGKLYGLTSSGGFSGNGVIFRLDANGSSYSILHDFVSTKTTGAYPDGSVIQGKNQKLYGVTSSGGITNQGVIFSTDLNGENYVNIHTFDYENGSSPLGPLLLLKNGKLYGATRGGGISEKGVIYSINPDGSNFNILHHFTNIESNPSSSLMEGSDGKLYGATADTRYYGYGMIYAINPDGTGYKVLHNFNNTDGANPFGSLIQIGTKLFGTTSRGGSDNKGVVFSMNSDGTDYTVLQNFTGTNGWFPFCSLIKGKDERLYGVTQLGGSSSSGEISGSGVIFSIK